MANDSDVMGAPVDIGWVPITQMRVTEKAQREFRPEHAVKLAESFDWSAVGLPLVNLRGDGLFYVIDGQHRIGALRLLGWDDQQVQCEITRGLSEPEEAALFLLRNQRRKVGTIDQFRAAVTAGWEPYVAINQVVEDCGLRIAVGRGQNQGIQAVGRLEAVYEQGGPQVLAATLLAVTEAWGPKGLQGTAIWAVGMVLSRYPDCDPQFLAHKLALVPGGVSGLMGQARTTKHQMGGSLGDAVAATVVEVYNSRRRGDPSKPSTKLLTSWWKKKQQSKSAA